MSTILIVDDSRDSREPLAKLMRISGYTVESAMDGVEALEAIGKQTPDLILLDLMMPRMDGVTLLKLLRSEGKYKDLPVIVLTANTDPKVVTELGQLGVKHCLTKSRFSFADLQREVKETLGEDRGSGKGWVS